MLKEGMAAMRLLLGIKTLLLPVWPKTVEVHALNGLIERTT